MNTHKIQSLRRIPTRPSKLQTSAFAHKEGTSLDYPYHIKGMERHKEEFSGLVFLPAEDM